MIEAVIFDEEQEFFLAQEVGDEEISIYRCGRNEKAEKYDSIVQLIYDFEMKFGKNVTCWEKMVTYGDREIYAVRVDMDDIYEKIESSDEYMMVPVSDLMNIPEICKDARWMVAMALDTKIRNKEMQDGKI